MSSKNHFTLVSVLNVLMAFCIVRFGLVMSVGYSIFSLTLVVAAGALVVLGYMYMSKIYCGQILQLNTLFLILNIFILFVLRTFTAQSDYISRTTVFIKQLMVLMLLWGFYLCLRMQTPQSRKKLITVYLSVVIISTLYTFYVALNGDDNVIRNTAFGEYDSQFRFVYGGFDFIYGLVIVYAALLIVLTQGWNKIKDLVKIGMILMLLLTASTVIISAYSTAFTLILVFTIFVAPKKIYTKITLFCVFAFSVFVIPEAIVHFIESIPFMPELTSSRLSELLLSFTGEASSGYITDDGQRLDRLLWSLEAFAANPILGVFANNSSCPLGYHTEWIDKLAMHGLLAAVCNFGFWIGTYSRIKQLSSNTTITRRCVVSAMILYFILGFLNPISMVVTSAPLFILCPFAEDLFVDDRLENR